MDAGKLVEVGDIGRIDPAEMAMIEKDESKKKESQIRKDDE